MGRTSTSKGILETSIPDAVPISSVIPYATVLTGMLMAIGRFGHIKFGNAEPDPDFARVFKPMAIDVLGGAVPYGVGMADNKPPGWVFMNIGAAATGYPLLVLLLFVGIAHGITAWLLFKWLSGQGLQAAGLFAVVLYLLGLLLVHGMWVTERAIAATAIMGALVVTSPFVRGALVGIAALMTAYAGLAIPFIGWQIYDRSRHNWRDLLSYGIGGACIAVPVFSAVGVVWGVGSMAAALHWSYGLPLLVDYNTSRYATFIPPPGTYLSRAWPVRNPLQWVAYIALYGSRLLPLIGLAAVAIHRYEDVSPGVRGPIVTTSLGALVFGLPLFVRSFAQYWLFPLPFLAMLAGIGGMILFERIEVSGRRVD